jgi:hypothetical protein
VHFNFLSGCRRAEYLATTGDQRRIRKTPEHLSTSLERLWGIKVVAVQDCNDVAIRTIYSLVPSVIDATVGFRDDLEMRILLQEFERPVARPSVDDPVLEFGVVLIENALNGRPDEIFAIQGSCDYRNLHESEIRTLKSCLIAVRN